MSKQSEKDRHDEARAGHRVNEARDAHERKAKADEREGGRKANEKLDAEHRKAKADEREGGRKANRELAAERRESDYPTGTGSVEGRPLTEELGKRLRSAGREMAGDGGGMMGDKGDGGLGPYAGVGGATGTPGRSLPKITGDHGPQG